MKKNKQISVVFFVCMYALLTVSASAMEISDQSHVDSRINPLHQAVDAQNVNSVRKLLVQGITHVNDQDEQGKTALHYAVLRCIDCTEVMIQLLLTHCADVNIQDNTGKTALHYAAACHGSREVRALLQNNNIDVDIQDNQGRTALMYSLGIASKVTYIKDSMLVLLAHNANSAIADNTGKTVMTYMQENVNAFKEILLQEDIYSDVSIFYGKEILEYQKALTLCQANQMLHDFAQKFFGSPEHYQHVKQNIFTQTRELETVTDTEYKKLELLKMRYDNDEGDTLNVFRYDLFFDMLMEYLRSETTFLRLRDVFTTIRTLYQDDPHSAKISQELEKLNKQLSVWFKNYLLSMRQKRLCENFFVKENLDKMLFISSIKNEL